MSLAFRIVAVIALLGTALALELAGESLISWHTAMRAGETARIAARSEALQEAAAALAVERGLVNGALSAPGTTTPGTTTPGTTTPGTAAPGTAAPGTIAPGAITPAQRAAIAAQRDRATSELNRALSGLETLDGLDAAAIAPLQESLRGSRARVDGLRAAIDGGGMPAPAAWFATATAQIDAVIALRRRLDAVSNEENDVTRLIAVRDALSDMAEFTGRERGRVNGMIAARTRLTPADFLELGTLRGRVETAWARVQSRLDVMPAAAVAPARAAGAALFEQFEAVRRPVLAAAQRGADPPVSAEQWFAAATGAIDAMRSAQVAAGTTLDAVMHERARLGWRHLALTLTLWAATLAAGLLAMWYVLFRVVRPLNRAIAAMHGLSEGALDIAVPPARGHDEIARLLRATAHFQETALAHRSLEDRQAALQRDSERSRVDAIHEVGALIERESELAVRNVTGLAEQVAEISGDVGRDVAAITAAARMAAELAAGGRHESDAAAGAAHGLNDAIQEIARQMETTTSTTRDVVAHTVETRASFDALFASVAEVQEVARLIGSIAARTNLLALNATIEAARAGEAGKGFAVVATEVKQLAHQTAQSTEQISARVGAIDVAARHAQQALDGIVKAVDGLDAIAAQVAAAVEQQSAATGQIAEAVQSASTAAGRTADQVTAVTDVAARCAEAVTATQAVSAQAVERISGLQTALMGILRSRVAELDRRAGVREAVALPARLLHGGGAVAGELRDLSPGGAQFEGDAPALTTARLQVAGLPEIAVRVAHRDGRLVNLAFKFTDATQRQAMADAVAALLASATVAHAA